MLEIVKAPNPILSQKAKQIVKVDKAVTKLIAEMIKSMESVSDPIGVGLAAPQVGKSLRLFIAKPSQKSKILVFINPKIVKKEKKLNEAESDSAKEKPASGGLSKATRLPKPGTGGQESASGGKEHKKLEGCLSLLNIWGSVERFDSVWISYQDETGKKHNRRFDGFLATILQHEIDHLDGILFPKRVLEQKGTLYKSEKDEKGEDIFEEIKL